MQIDVSEDELQMIITALSEYKKNCFAEYVFDFGGRNCLQDNHILNVDNECIDCEFLKLKKRLEGMYD